MTFSALQIWHDMDSLSSSIIIIRRVHFFYFLFLKLSISHLMWSVITSFLKKEIKSSFLLLVFLFPFCLVPFHWFYFNIYLSYLLSLKYYCPQYLQWQLVDLFKSSFWVCEAHFKAETFRVTCNSWRRWVVVIVVEIRRTN